MVKGTIIIADTSAIIRSGLIKIIQDIGNYNTIEVEDINHLQRKLRRLIPDLLIVGIDFYEPLIVFLKNEFRNTSIPIVKTDINSVKDFDINNTIYLNSTKVAIGKVIEDNLSFAENIEIQKTEQSELSSREITVIREIALGKTSKEIADKLFISAHTVLTHRKNINKKLDIKTASGLTVYAILNNIVKLEELEKVGI